jgi:hypothetical protein
MTHKKSKSVIASAVSLALTSMMLAGGAYAGVIQNTNTTPGAPLGSCGTTQAATEGCVGAMDLANVETKIYKADGTLLGTFNKTSGAYPAMGLADYFISLVMSGATEVAKLSGKVWPVGEPMAVKAVVGDLKTKEGKPNNCIINTSFLSADKNNGVSGYLDTANPVPVICSSDFQSHKRFKIPMQPASLDPANTPIDLVFNVYDESAAGNPAGLPSLPLAKPTDPPIVVNPNTNNLRYYTVFSKINNYTGKRLAGYKVVVGMGVGSAFKSASELGIADKLHLSIGAGEGWSDGTNALPNGTDLVDDEGMASFSHGLFGGIDNKHWFANGFFDERTAGFNVAQKCTTAAGADASCPPNYPNPLYNNTLPATDTVYSTTKLASNYNGPVVPAGTPGMPWGDWLPFGWEPKGIYWDFDNDPTTDADIVAWWNGTTWVKNYDSGFAPVSAAEFNTWANDPLYAIDTIEDALNLGISYTLKVGDNIDGDNDPATNPKITIRIIPIAAADQTAPVWVGTTPSPLVPPDTTTPTPTLPPDTTTPTPTLPPVVSSSGGGGGGGCAIGNDGRFDPTLPAMLFAGLGFLGWRRYKAGK